jgi:hypothetical protein
MSTLRVSTLPFVLYVCNKVCNYIERDLGIAGCGSVPFLVLIRHTAKSVTTRIII